MRVSRRRAMTTIGAAAAIPALHLEIDAASVPAEDFESILPAIAEVVLPSECDRTAAVAAFASWIANYKEGADTDHGYGNTRVRATGPSPAGNYPAQVAALDAAARSLGASHFRAATLQQRRAILEAAIAQTNVQRLAARPSGAHIATDLMAHYFNSSAAADLCYRANIGRDICRGLARSDRAPAPLARR